MWGRIWLVDPHSTRHPPPPIGRRGFVLHSSDFLLGEFFHKQNRIFPSVRGRSVSRPRWRIPAPDFNNRAPRRKLEAPGFRSEEATRGERVPRCPFVVFVPESSAGSDTHLPSARYLLLLFFKLDAFSPVGHIGPLRSRRGACFSGESKETWDFPALRIRAAAWG